MNHAQKAAAHPDGMQMRICVGGFEFRIIVSIELDDSDGLSNSFSDSLLIGSVSIGVGARRHKPNDVTCESEYRYASGTRSIR